MTQLYPFFPRPKTSPYASPICRISFQDGEPMDVHWQFIERCEEFASRILAMSGNSGIPNSAKIDDITLDAGHVIVHFLVTGRYETLEPGGDSDDERGASELATTLRVWNAAVSLNLEHIRAFLISRIPKLCEQLSLNSIIGVMHKATLPLSKFPKFAIYLEIRLMHAVLFDKMVLESEYPNTIGEILFRVLAMLNNKEFGQASGSQMAQLGTQLSEKMAIVANGPTNNLVNCSGRVTGWLIDEALTARVESTSEQPKPAMEVEKDDQTIDCPREKKVKKGRKLKKTKESLTRDEFEANDTTSAESATPSSAADVAEYREYSLLLGMHQTYQLPKELQARFDELHQRQLTMLEIWHLATPESCARTAEDELPPEPSITVPDIPSTSALNTPATDPARQPRRVSARSEPMPWNMLEIGSPTVSDPGFEQVPYFPLVDDDFSFCSGSSDQMTPSFTGDTIGWFNTR